MEIIGRALAGHQFRMSGHKKQSKYDNPLTDLVNMIIAETKSKETRREQRKVLNVDYTEDMEDED